MEQDGKILLSVLVTKEEYCEAAAMKKEKLRSHIRPLLYGAGAVLILMGAAGIFFGRLIYLSIPAAVCLVIAGIALACYDGLIAPILDRAAAAREFAEKEDLHFATTYIFEDGSVRIKNGRIEGEIPLSLLTRWSEGPTLFTMEIGRELGMAIPKRLLLPEQTRTLQAMLETHAGSVKIN